MATGKVSASASASANALKAAVTKHLTLMKAYSADAKKIVQLEGILNLTGGMPDVAAGNSRRPGIEEPAPELASDVVSLTGAKKIP